MIINTIKNSSKDNSLLIRKQKYIKSWREKAERMNLTDR